MSKQLFTTVLRHSIPLWNKPIQSIAIRCNKRYASTISELTQQRQQTKLSTGITGMLQPYAHSAVFLQYNISNINIHIHMQYIYIYIYIYIMIYRCTGS